jgi:hypothetical protein
MDAAERVIVDDVVTSDIFVGQQVQEVLLEAGVRAVTSTPLMSARAAESFASIFLFFMQLVLTRTTQQSNPPCQPGWGGCFDIAALPIVSQPALCWLVDH